MTCDYFLGEGGASVRATDVAAYVDLAACRDGSYIGRPGAGVEAFRVWKAEFVLVVSLEPWVVCNFCKDKVGPSVVVFFLSMRLFSLPLGLLWARLEASIVLFLVAPLFGMSDIIASCWMLLLFVRAACLFFFVGITRSASWYAFCISLRLGTSRISSSTSNFFDLSANKWLVRIQTGCWNTYLSSLSTSACP